MNTNRHKSQKASRKATVPVRRLLSESVEVIRLDCAYAKREYGLTTKEWRAFLKREQARHASEKPQRFTENDVRFLEQFGLCK